MKPYAAKTVRAPARIRSRDLVEALRFAWSAMRAHKTRTLLTGLSMLIANASVITAVSVALAGRDFVIRQIEGVGSNLLWAYYEAGGNATEADADFVTLADLEAVRERLGEMAAATSGVMTSWDWVSINGRSEQVRINGSNAAYREVRKLRILAGRFLDPADLEERAKVCLLTRQLAEKLYGSAARGVGETLKVHGLNFRVIGVFEEGVETFGQSEVAGNSILIPLTVIKYFVRRERVDPLYVSVASPADVERAGEIVRRTLESRHRPGSSYRVDNLTGVLETARRISQALTVLLVVTAAIMLSISGIFIMNIMLVSVSERTKEIGVRMAVGATRKTIRAQFLVEAVAISSLGGLLGVLVGVAIPLAAEGALPLVAVRLGLADAAELGSFPIPISPWSILAALLVSITTGAVFGLLPAARAARLDPVEALRHE